MLIFLVQYWSFLKFISKNKLFSLNIISGSIMAAHARIFNTISCTWSMIIPRNIIYIFFLLSTIYSCPRRCAYTILGTFFVYICTVHTVQYNTASWLFLWLLLLGQGLTLGAFLTYLPRRRYILETLTFGIQSISIQKAGTC